MKRNVVRVLMVLAAVAVCQVVMESQAEARLLGAGELVVGCKIGALNGGAGERDEVESEAAFFDGNPHGMVASHQRNALALQGRPARTSWNGDETEVDVVD